MFALVKYKCDGKIGAVPVERIGVVVRENGEKTFVAYKPTSASDFIVSKKFKYVVDLEDEYGITRRWFVMIGRLGASPEEVLDDSCVQVIWPERKVAVRAFEPTHGDLEDMPNTDVATFPRDTERKDANDQESIHNVTKKATSCQTEVFTKSESTQTNAEAGSIPEKFKELREMEEKLEKTKVLCNMYQNNLPDFTDVFLVAVERAFKTKIRELDSSCYHVLQRVEAIEKSVFELKSQIMKGANMRHVQEWLNNVSVCMPEDMLKTALDVLPEGSQNGTAIPDTLSDMSDAWAVAPKSSKICSI